MIKIAELKTSCNPRYILQNLDVLKNKPNRLEYLTDTLERCATTPITKKRAMSGYNCFVRVMSKKGNKNVIKSRSWSQLEDKSKAHWKNLAKEGCSPKLWE